MTTILYYPLISIRTGIWLRQALLYWDQIGSIVPQNYEDEALLPYTPDMEYLKAEGEFRPFRPDALLGQNWDVLHDFDDDVLQKIAAGPLVLSSSVPFAPKFDFPIHRDKISHHVFDLLEQEGLAVCKRSDPDWYYCERRFALSYMSLLAKHLAEVDSDSTVPSTNFPAYEKLNFQARPGMDLFICLKARFRDILPVPRRDVPLADILEFKRRRRDQLLAFRQQISATETTLSRCKSEAEVTEVLQGEKTRIESGLLDLASVLADAKMPTVLGTFEALTKAALPASVAPLLVIAGKAASIATVPISVALFGSVTTGAISISKYLVDRRNEQRATMRNSPFAYLHAAKYELGFSSTSRRNQ